jgi:hypothetical protein
MENHLAQHKLTYAIHDRSIEIVLDEKDISSLLASLAGLGVSYSSITIAKPNLEDYFLKIARSGKN